MSADMRTTLEDLALGMIRESGPRAFTMAELSRRAGVSVAAPYKHFTDKGSVLGSLAARASREHRDRVLAAIATAEDPTAKLIAYAQAIVRFSDQDRAMFELAMTPDGAFEPTPAAVASTVEVDAALLAAAGALSADDDAGSGLVIRVRACARGVADFRRQGTLHPGRDSLADAEDLAAWMVRALVVDSTDPARRGPEHGVVATTG